MKEIDEKDETSIIESKSKNETSEDYSQKKKRSFISLFSEDASILKENKKMIVLIKKLKQMKKQGKTFEEFYSIIPQLLKEINSNITEIVDENNNSLAHLLVNEENIELLKIICNVYYLLLINKNDFYTWFFKENNEKMTILDIASIKAEGEILQYLYGIISRTDGSKLKFNFKKNNFFHFSAKYNRYYSILFWYDKLQLYFPNLKIIDLSNNYNITPLQYACYHGAINCVELLLDLQADINAIDQDGKSVLTYAVYSGNIRIIKKLLIRGADKRIKDFKGKTPYNYACENNKLNISYLLKNLNYIDKIKKYFKCNKNILEIKQLKNDKNDFELILYLLFYLIFIIIFSLRIIFVSDYQNLQSSKIYITFSFYCLGLNIFFLFISLILTIYFKCIVSYKQHIKNNKKNLLRMYDNSSNICIKCIRIKKSKTIHCAVCNLCIDDWDHHCFWLNACITTKNKKKIVIFLISIICLFFTNIFFSICFLIIYYLENENYRDIFILKIFTSIENKDNILIFKYFYVSFFFIYFILFTILFIYNLCSIMFSSQNSRRTNEKISRESSYINENNMKKYHGQLIDSYIDRNNDD